MNNTNSSMTTEEKRNVDDRVFQAIKAGNQRVRTIIIFF
jgi:hypothetical protein